MEFEISGPVRAPVLEETAFGAPSLVYLKHPGRTRGFLLYVLAACVPLPEEYAASTGKRFGVLHSVARDICQIIAKNQPGFLTTSALRDEGRLGDNMNKILPDSEYYYHLGEDIRSFSSFVANAFVK